MSERGRERDRKMLRKSWIAWFRLERAIFTVVVSTLFLPYFQIALHSVPSFNCVTISTLHHSSSLPQASASLRVCILFPFFAEISIVSYFYLLFCVRSFRFHLIPLFSVYLFITDSNARQREDKAWSDTNRETKSRWYRNKGSEKGKCI